MTGATLLPDLQELEVTYSKEDVKQVEWRLKSVKANSGLFRLAANLLQPATVAVRYSVL